jgi:hypothetical protein
LPTNLHRKALRERVHHGATNTMETTRNCVSTATELATCVKNSEDHLYRRLLLDGVFVNGNSPTVVDDSHAAISEQRDVNGVTVTGKCLVNRVVYDLVDEVVKAPRPGRANVHTGTLTDSLQPFEYLNVSGTIAMVVPR